MTANFSSLAGGSLPRLRAYGRRQARLSTLPALVRNCCRPHVDYSYSVLRGRYNPRVCRRHCNGSYGVLGRCPPDTECIQRVRAYLGPGSQPCQMRDYPTECVTSGGVSVSPAEIHPPMGRHGDRRLGHLLGFLSRPGQTGFIMGQTYKEISGEGETMARYATGFVVRCPRLQRIWDVCAFIHLPAGVPPAVGSPGGGTSFKTRGSWARRMGSSRRLMAAGRIVWNDNIFQVVADNGARLTTKGLCIG